MKIAKRLQAAVILYAFAVLGAYSSSYALMEDMPRPQQSQAEAIFEQNDASRDAYQPAVVIVKFKEATRPDIVLRKSGLAYDNASRLYPIEPALTRHAKDYRLEKDNDGWYWFLDKNYQPVEKVSAEAVFQQVYQAMTETEKGLYRTYLVNLQEATTVEEAVKRLKTIPEVEYVQPDHQLRIQSTATNDPYFSSSGSWGQDYADLWGLRLVNAEQAWDVTEGLYIDGPDKDKPVVVAVIDTGVDYNHPDIKDNIWINYGEDINHNGLIDIADLNGKDDDNNGYIDDLCGFDFANNDADPADGHGHGTHCAGIIAALRNNGIGIAGVAPKAKVMVLKGLKDNGAGYDSNLAKAIVYAANQGARVLSNSWGGVDEGPENRKVLEEAFNYAYLTKNALCIAAAGNFAMDTAKFIPANLDSVMAVGALNENNSLCWFSNYGAEVDVVAPGGGDISQGSRARNILSLRSGSTDMYGDKISLIPQDVPGARYYRSQGTSMACPHVAGLAALLFARYPDANASDIWAKICITADDIGKPGKDLSFGYGRINAALAVGIPISAKITAPVPDTFLHNIIEVRGSAFAAAATYQLFYAPVNDINNLAAITTTAQPATVKDSLLYRWDTSSVPDGEYYLILRMNYASGRSSDQRIRVKTDNINEPPVWSRMQEKAGICTGEPVSFLIEASDPDDPETTGALTYQLQASDFPDYVNFDSKNGLLYSQIPLDKKGKFFAQFSATDGTHTISQRVDFPTVYWEEKIINEPTFGAPPVDASLGCPAYGFPVISKNKICWRGERFSLPGRRGLFHHFYVYDLKSGVSTRVTETPVSAGNYLFNQEAILFGNLVLDSGGHVKGNEVCLADLRQTDPEKRIVRLLDDGAVYGWGVLSGRQAIVPQVLRESETVRSSTYRYDFTSVTEQGELNLLLEQSLPQGNYGFWACGLYQDKIVGLLHGHDKGLMLFDPNSREFLEPNIEPLTLGWWKIGVWENYAVYSRHMSQRAKTYPPLPDYDIYLYDLARQKELAVFQNSFGQEELIDISGDKIAWLSQEGWRYSVSYSRPTEICQYVNRYLLRMYDISSGFTYQVQDITASTGRQLSDPTGISFSQNRFASERVISYRDAEDRLMMDDVLQLTSVYFLPQIETIEPRIANPGQEVSVQGLNFGFEQETEGRCQVLVNGEVANEVRIWQDKEIRLLLPKGLPEGRAKIQVKTPGGESNQFELAVAGGGAGYSLAIDAERGAVSRIPDKAIYSAGEKVELTVTADRGYKFERWSGDLSGSANPAVVTMDAHKYIKACFVPELFTVNITALNGTVSKTPDKSGYLYGERLKLTATANPKYIFKKWEGDLSTTANPVTITVDADKTILANFIPAAPSPPPYKIIMKSLPLGAGTISRSPFKIFYNRGEEVTLTAHPKPGYYFANWSGDAKGCTNQATIIMDDNKNIEANFYEGGYVLNIETSPTNSGSIARSPDTEAYMAGSTVLLTSTPAAGFRFSGWAGDISGSENPAIVIMDAHKNITAKFSPKIECYLLEITAPNGSVQKVPDKTTYTHGEVVTLTAVPDPGYQFDSWSGDISGKENPAAISMDGTKNIAANFSLKPNSPPAAVITSPASGSRLKPPITITADASDIDGTIKKLEFFDGTTKLGEDTSFPYAYTWDSPSKGRHIITARATDNNDASTPSAEVEIEVLGNTAPMAYDSSVSTQEDNQIAVVMHAEDADNDKLNYSIMSAPANGRLRWPYEPDGDTIYYIPNADYFGTDSFSFRVYDGEAYSNIATVTISAEPVDDKPEIVEVKVGAVILMAGESTSLKVEAVDVDTDNLSYLWEATEGTIISPQSSQTSYRAPSEVSSDTAVTLTVTVRDASSAASRSTAVTVIKKPAIRHSLNILAVNGRVEKRVGGVETPETSFPEGTVVELTAIPNSGYEFSHWKGTSVVNQNQTSRNPINVVIDKDIFLAASFRCNFTPRFLGIYSYSQSPFIAQRSKTNPNYYILTIAERKFAILGWKKPGTAVYLNGRLIARLDNNDYWRYYYDGSRGVSDLNFYAQDTNGNKSDNLTIQVILR